MIDNPFRSWLSTRSQFVIEMYRRLGLSPNGITVGALILASLASFLCALGFDLGAILLWWLSRFLDGTDGIFARHENRSTPFGAYLDIVCDMASYSLMVIGLLLRFPSLSIAWMVIIVLYVLCITSALAFGSIQAELKVAPTDNRGLRLGAGLVEGGETGIAYTVFLLIPSWIDLWVYLWIALLTATVGFRTLLAYRVLKVSK